jgi:hypothetical protein
VHVQVPGALAYSSGRQVAVATQHTDILEGGSRMRRLRQMEHENNAVKVFVSRCRATRHSWHFETNALHVTHTEYELRI